jgi:hypothetical protein
MEHLLMARWIRFSQPPFQALRTSRERFLVFFLSIIVPSAVSQAADDLASQAAALKLIRETAADICYTVEQRGSQRESQLSGEAEAKLTGAISKVIEMGVKGSGQLKNQEYQGVVREELASTIKNSADCRKDVFNKLIEKLLPTEKPGADTRAPLRLSPAEFLAPSNTRDDWRAIISKYENEYNYLVVINVREIFKNNTFNQISYLNSLGDTLRVLGDGLGFTVSEKTIEDALNLKLYLKLKDKPREEEVFHLESGPRKWTIQYGKLEWNEVVGSTDLDKPIWWRAGAILELVNDDPDWVILHSFRALPVMTNAKGAQDTLFEVNLENRTFAPAAIDGLTLTAVQKKTYYCSIGPGYQPPPPIPMKVNWPEIIKLGDLKNAYRDAVLVTVADVVVSASATYRPESCVNNEDFTTEIPMQINLSSMEMARITIRVNEITSASDELVRSGSPKRPTAPIAVRPFLNWDKVGIAAVSAARVFPRQLTRGSAD